MCVQHASHATTLTKMNIDAPLAGIDVAKGKGKNTDRLKILSLL